MTTRAVRARRLIAVVVAALGLMLLSAGCGLGSAVDRAVDQAVNQIDRGIDTIRNDSTKWQSTLKEVSEKLPEDVQTTIRTEMNQLVARSIAKTGVEFRCDTDFLAARAVQGLQRIRALLTNKPVETIKPTVCHAVPEVLNINEPAPTRSSILLAGYDMDRQDKNGKLLRVVLFSDQTGEQVELGEDRVARTTHYVVNLNVDGADFEKLLRDRKISKIRVSWDDPAQTSNLSEILVIPRKAKTRTITAALGEMTHNPTHIGGDGDFDTDDDEHMSFRVIGQSEKTDTQIRVRAFMRAREERSDWTTVDSWSDWQIAYQAPAGWAIKSVTPLGQSERAGNITDHRVRSESLSQGEVVNRFDVFGDREGDEAGSHTRVKVYFNPVEVALEEVLP